MKPTDRRSVKVGCRFTKAEATLLLSAKREGEQIASTVRRLAILGHATAEAGMVPPGGWEAR